MFFKDLINRWNVYRVALRSLAKGAKQLKATVHLPRIGVGSQGKYIIYYIDLCDSFSWQGFNWYGTEKLIKKYLSSRGIPTYIYYFKRDGATASNKRSHEQSYGNNKRLPIESKTFDYFRQSDMEFLFLEKTNHMNQLKVHLPNYLSGVHIFFHDIDDNTKKRLQRFVYAYVYNTIFCIKFFIYI